MASGVYLSHSASLEHDTGAHPERAARIVAIEQAMAREEWLGLARVEAPTAPPAAIAAVHPGRYAHGIRELCEAGGGAIDADTVVSEGSYVAALHAAGGAIALVDMLLAGEAATGISALRPPGHHAEPDRAMGFCLFNNVAIAARHARDAHGLERVLILDWDVHHGNGTNAAFHESREVLFVSIHQSPLYPGTGPAGDRGSGEGVGYTVNVPVAAGTGGAAYRSLVEHVVLPLARAYEPQLVLISAGFDAHRDDPLAGILLDTDDFAAMAASVRRLGAELEVPVGAVLEGGYQLDALASSVVATMRALTARDPAPAPALAVAPEARVAAQRLAELWPALTGA